MDVKWKKVYESKWNKWKKDLFQKAMVSIAVGFMVASYNILSDFIIDSSKFKGEMMQFKIDTEEKLNTLTITQNGLSKIQASRSTGSAFIQGLQNGNKEKIEHICGRCD